eukprot:6186670-Pleurochrysis_carterae.AAC.1
MPCGYLRFWEIERRGRGRRSGKGVEGTGNVQSDAAIRDSMERCDTKHVKKRVHLAGNISFHMQPGGVNRLRSPRHTAANASPAPTKRSVMIHLSWVGPPLVDVSNCNRSSFSRMLCVSHTRI